MKLPCRAISCAVQACGMKKLDLMAAVRVATKGGWVLLQTNSGVSITYPMNEAPVAATTPTPEPASQASLTTALASSLWVNRERTSGREEINAVRKPSR